VAYADDVAIIFNGKYRLRKILSKTAAPLGYLQKANGSCSDFSKESLDLLLDAHFPGSQQTGHPPKEE